MDLCLYGDVANFDCCYLAGDSLLCAPLDLRESLLQPGLRGHLPVFTDLHSEDECGAYPEDDSEQDPGVQKLGHGDSFGSDR